MQTTTGQMSGDGPADDVKARTEQRMARIICYVRVSTSIFAFLPLTSWSRLEHPLAALGAALAASVEAAWFWRRVRRTGTVQDRWLVWLDVLFCLALTAVGSRAAFPGQRLTVMTEFVPFALASPACVGFGLGLGVAGAMAILLLIATWALSAIPNVTLKLSSDLLGFVLWYLVAVFVGRELRNLSRQTALAQEAAVQSARQLAEHQAEVARHQMHDVLLPIVEEMASGAELSDDFVRRLRREAGRARQLLDPRVGSGVGLRALLMQICETFSDAGLRLETVIEIRDEPPAEVSTAVAAVAREALNNVRKHSGSSGPVLVRADGGCDHIEVVIRDRGRGFDPKTVLAGGGLSTTFRAVRRYGCECTVESSPGAGTKVSVVWRAPDAA